MGLTVRPVDVNYVAQTWPLVKSFLEPALHSLESSGDDECYNIDQVQSFISSGSWLLLVFIDESGIIHGAATISFINYPKQRVAFITLLGGRLVVNTNTIDQIKDVCRMYGATSLQAYATGAKVRLWGKYGMKPNATVMSMQL